MDPPRNLACMHTRSGRPDDGFTSQENARETRTGFTSLILSAAPMIEQPNTPVAQTIKAARLFNNSSSDTKKRIDKAADKFQTSWWDSAAISIAASSPSKGILVRGRNHARAEMKSVSAWREAACDAFVGGATNAATLSLSISTPPEPLQEQCHSPCHFARKYGKQVGTPRTGTPRAVRLEPLFKASELPHCGTIFADGAPRHSRERANAEARAACWRAAREKMAREVAESPRAAAAL